ncbi:hypothetical protein H5T52_04545 [Candidatus Bipolaricaulota bacterium]|nr:hypothetical protein [Candidatus Bipolaricaulota bacterium]
MGHEPAVHPPSPLRPAVKLASRLPDPPAHGVIPQAIFTQPEIGLVGLSEEEARAAGYEVSTGRFPLGALGRAQGRPLHQAG